MYRLPDERYEFIKQEVVHLFKHFDVNSIPINGFELAYKIGIRLIPYSTLNKRQRKKAFETSPDGFFLETRTEELIFFNDLMIKENFSRVNMTIIHEIAHDVLGHTGQEENSEMEEAEARFFAKYAVAPPPLIHRLSNVTPCSIQRVFLLSEEAAMNAYRYYQKWLHYGKEYYLEYEMTLLKLFPETA